MDQQRFDYLARYLATTTSRREVLRRMGAGLAGGVLASLFPAMARGAETSNSACAQFCTSVFPPGSERGTCISAAAKSEGICFKCGPGAPTPPSKVLCQGQCVPACTGGQILNPETCECECPSEAELCNGACVAVCPGGQLRNPVTCACECPDQGEICNGVCCAAGEQCVDGSCQPAICTPGSSTQCGLGCTCVTTSEGTTVCVQNEACRGIVNCTATSDCTGGRVCVPSNLCSSLGVCLAPCAS